MCVTDPILWDFLGHLHYGCMQEKHIQMLCSLVLVRAGSKSVDFQSELWNSASLVTPRHAVWRLWNEAAAWKRCRESGEHLYICTAKDHIRNWELTLAKCYSVAACAKMEKQRKCKDLPWRIELLKGMKVLVTDNVETDLDIMGHKEKLLILSYTQMSHLPVMNLLFTWNMCHPTSWLNLTALGHHNWTGWTNLWFQLRLPPQLWKSRWRQRLGR